MKKFVGVIYIVIILLVANQMVLFKVQYDNGFDSENHIMCSDEVEEFSDELCSGKKKDKEKVMAIYGWIKENVCYDYEANPLYQHIDIEKTLQTKKGICYDYACLFAALCHCQGIPCYVLDGYSRENSSDTCKPETTFKMYFKNIKPALLPSLIMWIPQELVLMIPKLFLKT